MRSTIHKRPVKYEFHTVCIEDSAATWQAFCRAWDLRGRGLDLSGAFQPSLSLSHEVRPAAKDEPLPASTLVITLCTVPPLPLVLSQHYHSISATSSLNLPLTHHIVGNNWFHLLVSSDDIWASFLFSFSSFSFSLLTGAHHASHSSSPLSQTVGFTSRGGGRGRGAAGPRHNGQVPPLATFCHLPSDFSTKT